MSDAQLSQPATIKQAQEGGEKGQNKELWICLQKSNENGLK